MRIKKITFILLFILFETQAYSQLTCGDEYTITVCDMTTVDSDNMGVADGILNIYNEFQLQNPTLAPFFVNGIWEPKDPSHNFLLNTATSDIELWALLSTDTNGEKGHAFYLYSGDCIDNSVPSLTINLVLGGYSGVAVPTLGGGSTNAEICDNDTFNLFELLYTDEPGGVPAAHKDGVWTYTGTNTSVFLQGDNSEIVEFKVPYQPGAPLLDQEIFDFEYTVIGLEPCDSPAITSVKVSGIRAVDAGVAEAFEFCESELRSVGGPNDVQIDLRDDDYLSGEDLEGYWSSAADPTNQISGLNDSNINLKEVYDELITRSPNFLRFGCQEFSYTYTVPTTSLKCPEDSSTIRFLFKEELQPFGQDVSINPIPELCPVGTFDLYDLLTFTTIGTNLFDYPSNSSTNWRLISGPDELEIKKQFASDYSYRGTVNLENADAGTYVFEYGVHPNVNCSIKSNSSPFSDPPNDDDCLVMLGTVTIEVLSTDYPGTNTTASFCEPANPTLDLLSFMDSDGTTIATNGQWTLEGVPVLNNFEIPSFGTDSSQVLNFVYETTSAGGCLDSASLQLTIYEKPNAGPDVNTEICRAQANSILNLFDYLTTDPNVSQTGFWVGPSGYSSEFLTTPHLGEIDLSSDLTVNGSYRYILQANQLCNDVLDLTSTVELTIQEVSNAGAPVSGVALCRSIGQVNLFDVLTVGTDLSGSFVNLLDGEILANGSFVFGELPVGPYDFEYRVPNGTGCVDSVTTVQVLVTEVAVPDQVRPTEFCILDVATIGDINEVLYVDNNGVETVLGNYEWYDTISGDTPASTSTLLENGATYFVSAVDGNSSCESNRLAVTIKINNLGEKGCTIALQDGVVPNLPNDPNGTFNLTEYKGDNFNIPIAFSEFELFIYNRYGTLVFEANKDTGEFVGIDNKGIQLGKKLPSGVYFYVLNTNKNNNKPLQGNFYLSN